MTQFIDTPPLPWNRPSIGAEEIAEVVDTLASGWLTHGPKATRFEQAVRDALGVEDTFAVSSCTAALHLAALAAGISPGDEVITPSLTFCAAPNVLTQVGARPVFVDVEPVTFNVCPKAAEAAITDRTKAIVVMHYGGHPCDLRAFRKLADEHGLLLIEDAAHALHASRDGQRAGSVGDLAVFSFYANKVMTTGEGGMLAGRSELVQRARLLGRHGIDSSVWQRHGTRSTADYEVVVPGLKYVMPDVTAAIGLQQFAKLPAFTARRAEIAATYTQALTGLPGLATPTVLPGVEHGWFLYSIFVDPDSAPLTRDETAHRLLADHGIATSRHFKPVHTLQLYDGAVTHPLPVTETATARQLSLPCYPSMTSQDVDRVVTAIHALWNR
ncbi:dTDP-4-amino-4,6-dideoxygalactose transaminase [Streptosporangium becharense]|uniref:dTDP-4-amino-4,6-dideoxygalactose transaminase n=1 Tax=Streptosporangium becharense TaxID=1816182 RepID=A0A7W9IAQ5_9ACTN|nr:DegT/DnrJ/EryC1/StrS family aminotransferase [Streptosporangium becharense]MBB2914255.1 dTDP-4-amino-4,6-dideoxygalactose transaminase [Streptosporangium becharense]MBB5817282.1 dTDP-4-amino-4,6-dideoxygalactose transaminase [Streptosporangium becharense]